MLSNSKNMRPNIRVEIQNNATEPMEVDDNEEGELSEEEIESIPQANPSKIAEEPTVTIPDREKLEERARRFHLNPGEVKNFTKEDLKNLHKSLGISESNKASVRFTAVHVRGMNQFDAKAIVNFFNGFAPISVEWIDEESCNVIWDDKESAARALHFTSKPVNGMPVRDDSGYFFSMEETDQDVGFANESREIQLVDDSDIQMDKASFQDSVEISEITSKIPPGHWRLANDSKTILLRFSLNGDKQPINTEPLARYYNTLQAKRSRGGIFSRNREMDQSSRKDNPWTVLAKNWDEDAQFRERDSRYVEPRLQVKNPSLKVRLGNKRDGVVEVADEEEPVKKPKKLRMKMYADEEEEKIRRKKMLKKIDTQIKQIDETAVSNSDLRRILNLNSHTNAARIEKTQPQIDLGSTLKNRRNMVFELQTELEMDREESSRKSRDRAPERVRTDARERIRKERHYEDEYEDEDCTFRSEKPRSKVALVIKTQKRPAVASTVASSIWSRVERPKVTQRESSSSSEESQFSESESGDEQEEADSNELRIRPNVTSRPGFRTSSKLVNEKTPLKIEISNDKFRKK